MTDPRPASLRPLRRRRFHTPRTRAGKRPASPHREPRPFHYSDLDDPEHLNRLADPQLALEPLEGLIVIDEIQRNPELFPLAREAGMKVSGSRFRGNDGPSPTGMTRPEHLGMTVSGRFPVPYRRRPRPSGVIG